MPGGSPLVAFFDMNTRRGAPLQHVHEMLREVVHQMGRTNCGDIKASEPCEHGRYIVTFTSRTAADLFERLYRRTGHNPVRSATPPPGSVVLEVEIVGGVLMTLRDFMQRMNANLN